MTKHAVLDDALPDGRLRAPVARFLASSLEVANRTNADSWGLTIEERGLAHLNVGMPYALSVGARLSISVIAGTIPTELLSGDDLELEGEEAHPRGDVFKSVFGSRILAVEFTTPRRLASILSTVEQCHIDFIKRAATTGRNPRTRVGHSPEGVLRLAKIVGRQLPEPRYARTSGRTA